VPPPPVTPTRRSSKVGFSWASGSSPPPARCLHECLHAARVVHIRAVSIFGAAEPLRTGSLPQTTGRHLQQPSRKPATATQDTSKRAPAGPSPHARRAPPAPPAGQAGAPSGARLARPCRRFSAVSAAQQAVQSGRCLSRRRLLSPQPAAAVCMRTRPPQVARQAPKTQCLSDANSHIRRDTPQGAAAVEVAVFRLLAAAPASCLPFAAASVTSAGCRPAAGPRNGGARSAYWPARLVKSRHEGNCDCCWAVAGAQAARCSRGFENRVAVAQLARAAGLCFRTVSPLTALYTMRAMRVCITIADGSHAGAAPAHGTASNCVSVFGADNPAL